MSHQYTFPLAAIVAGFMMLAVPRPAAAQGQPPPLNGFNATIALPESMVAFYKGLHEAAEAVGDGLEHLTPGGSDGSAQGHAGSLDDLRPGIPVVVHYSVKGVQASANADTGSSGMTPNEGTITRIDRRNKRIAVQFEGGTTQTFRAADEPDHDSSRVIVYLLDGHAPGIAYYFKPVR